MPKGDFTGSVGYSTHQATLVKYALQAPEGSTIVELGCGYFSTVILSQIAAHRKLRYIVYTDDKEWSEVVKPSCLDNIEWNIISDWQKWKPTDQAYFYFLDNSELVVNRFKQIAKMKGLSEYVIIHDSDVYPRRGIDLSVHYSVIETDTTRVPNTSVIDLRKPFVELKQPKEQPKEQPPEITIDPEKVKLPKNGNQQTKFRFSNIKEPLIDVGYVDNPIPIPKRAKNKNDKDDKNDKNDKKEEQSHKVAVVCCYTPGGDYDENCLEYIQRLADGIHENNTIGADFFCISIMNLSKLKNVKRIEPLNGNWKGWHIKAEVFRADLWEDYDRVLYIDLDTVIVSNIDKILSSKSEITLLRDFYQPDVWETGMIWFKPGLLDMYAEFNPNNPPPVTKKDAEIVRNYLMRKNIEPDFFQDKYSVGSYKISLVREQNDYNRYCIVCFHGNPRPHEIDWDLDARINRKGPCGNRPDGKRKGYDRKGPSGDRVNKKNKKRNPVIVNPIWQDEDAFIIGGGPSLINVDLDKLLSDKNVLGINDGYLFDCCDICFFGDTVWHQHHKDELEEWCSKSSGNLVYSTSGVYDDNVLYLESAGTGLTDIKTKLCWNQCSGWAGLNLALNLGAKRIFLLGFDMRFGEDGESNWHENIRKVNRNSYNVFLRNQESIQADYKRLFDDRMIYNVEIGKIESQVQIFPKIKIEELFGIPEKEIYKSS